MTTVDELLDDLGGEHAALDAVVAGRDDEAWATPTPSPGWTVADQIGHLAYFDGTATLALGDPDGFRAVLAELLESLSASGGGDDMDAVTLGRFRAMSPGDLLDAWRAGRRALLDAGKAADPSARVPWYGPDMSLRSFLTARLMETWAHGQDVVDALGADRPATDRLRHVAQLGFITRGWSYANRGRVAPDVAVRVVLDSPSGGSWSFGDAAAPESVTGPVEDFCLVVTQRRNIADTALVVDGAAAAEWMAIAQAFAGGVTDPPAPRGSVR